MAVTALSAGYNSFGPPVLGASGVLTTGDVYFVDSGSSQASDGNAATDQKAPAATWDGAIAKCTANNGDVIFLMPGHSETVTTAIAMDVAGVRVIGLGWGRSIPAITPSGTIDCVNVTAANCVIENVRFIGAAASVTAQINVAGDDFTGHKLVIQQDAVPLIGVTIAGADRFHFSDCLFLGTAAGPDVGIDIEAGDSSDWVVEDCVFNYVGSTGLDLAGIRASKQQTGGLVKNCDFIGMNVTAIDINSSVSALSDGMIVGCNIAAIASVANIDTLIDAGGYILVENHGSDLPAEAGGLVPVATPA